MAKVQEERKYWNEKIETMPRPELEKLQLERLKEIVKFSYENSPFFFIFRINRCSYHQSVHQGGF